VPARANCPSEVEGCKRKKLSVQCSVRKVQFYAYVLQMIPRPVSTLPWPHQRSPIQGGGKVSGQKKAKMLSCTPAGPHTGALVLSSTFPLAILDPSSSFPLALLAPSLKKSIQLGTLLEALQHDMSSREATGQGRHNLQHTSTLP
jgi:hypothetical protein